MTARLRVVPIRAGSAQYYAGAVALRTLATSALLRGEYRSAAQMHVEAKALKNEGDAVLVAELEGSLRNV